MDTHVVGWTSTGSKLLATREVQRVIVGASLGTLFEWYDFLIYGSLTPYISKHFFSGVNPTAAYIFTLLGFSAGFFIRPIGAVLFGRIGDLAGRKFTFLITMMLMGLMTFLIGLVPDYETIGIAAPVTLIVLRLLQGLAMGGEYGGAATYVAEYAPAERRGAYTSLIQVTATGGLLLALIVFLGCRAAMDAAAFDAWGWRVPFLLSLVLLAISIWIRLKLKESPVFEMMKNAGRRSTAPVMESFGRWDNLKIVLLAFCMSAGPAVLWACSQFYSLFFITQTLKVDSTLTSQMLMIALLLAAPFFLIFGWLSDYIGRKPIVLGGLLIAAVAYIPVFQGLTHYANPALESAMAQAPATVVADPNECSVQFNPVGTAKFVTSCDVAKTALVTRGVPYSNQDAAAGSVAHIKIGAVDIESYNAAAPDAKDRGAAFTKTLGDTLKSAGYPSQADPASVNKPMLILLLFILILFVAIAYGPLAAMLAELFPARIRYTSFSLPYHIGSGWFGGFVPAVAFAIQAKTGNLYNGLWFTIIVAGFAFIVGLIFLRETKDLRIER